LDLRRPALARARERRGTAPGEVFVPLRPRAAVVDVLEGGEERVVVEPGLLPPAEGGEGALVRRSPARLEAFVCAVEEGKAEARDRLVVHRGFRKRGSRIEVGRGEPALVHERFGADEQRVAREGREALVGRVAVSSRAERKHLPEALLRSGEEI